MTTIPDLPEGIDAYTPVTLASKRVEKKEGLNIIVPVSGGKDSLACLLLALEHTQKENVTAVFNDTGWDHPVTYSYLDYLRKKLEIKIHVTIGQSRRDGARASTLIELIKAQGRFPFGLGRFCTTHLKQYALKKWYEKNLFDGITKYSVWFGMRTRESSGRAAKYAGIESTDIFNMEDMFPSRYTKAQCATLTVRLPVVDWTEEQVFLFAEKRGIKRNPLYYEGTNDRVGCYPCMLASKSIQTKIFNTEEGKKRLAIIRQLEKELGIKYEMFDTDQGSCELCKI